MANQLIGYLSVRDWKTRLVFWLGAMAVGLTAAAFAILSSDVFTGVVQIPLTASVIVMEMVNDGNMVFPIMATVFIALGAPKIVCRQPIYWALADEFTIQPPKAKSSTEESRQNP